MEKKKQILVGQPPAVKTGTCELCGGHNMELRILFLQDYIGWTCKECREQIQKSQQRRYVSTMEETEPAE